MNTLLQTPLLEVQWCKLLGEPETNRFEPNKPPVWSVEAILDTKNQQHAEWLLQQEDEFTKQHGINAKISANSLPKKEDGMLTLWTFKLKRFTRKRDGGFTSGPLVVDSHNNIWNHDFLIGNGSKMIIAYEIYPWKGPTGVGLAYQPRQAQVVSHIAYERSADPVFEKVQGGYVNEEAEQNTPVFDEAV
tara:strand:+ start:374 stop:940 length:567 start_codon:yes stop_codon:yes gene_type:complete